VSRLFGVERKLLSQGSDHTMKETLTIEVPSGTRRRLEIMGFPHDLNGRDVLCFLIEQGLAVLEKHRRLPPGTTPKAA
jgi:hypothetical protein